MRAKKTQETSLDWTDFQEAREIQRLGEYRSHLAFHLHCHRIASLICGTKPEIDER